MQRLEAVVGSLSGMRSEIAVLRLRMDLTAATSVTAVRAPTEDRQQRPFRTKRMPAHINPSSGTGAT